MDTKPRYIVEASREGSPTLAVLTGESRSYLHSKISPSREGASLASEFRPDRYDVLIVLGVGLGYHLMPLAEMGSQYRRILLIDALPGLEEEIAQNPLSSFIVDQAIRIISGLDMAEMEESLQEFLTQGASLGIQVIEHPASIRLFPEYYGAVKRAILKAIERFGANTATRAAFGPRYLRNAILNIPAIDRSIPVMTLFEGLKGSAGVVVTSGPTLDRALPHLKKYRPRVIVIAVDSAVSSLVGAGIAPDFAVSIDPQQHVCEHFVYEWPDSLKTVHSATSYPLSLRRRPGFIALNSHPVSQLMEELRPDRTGSIDSLTGTVAGDALLLAHRMGLSPIGLVGFDFCFTDHTIYARNTAYQRRFSLYFQNRFKPVETQNLSYIMKSSGGHIIDGRFSRRSFEVYRLSIEKLLKRESIANVHRLEPTPAPIEGAADCRSEAFFASIPEKQAITVKTLLEEIDTHLEPLNTSFNKDLAIIFNEDDVLERVIGASLEEKSPTVIKNSIRRKIVHLLNMEKKK